MWYFSAAFIINNIGNVCITYYCKFVCYITEWVKEELLFCDMLIFKCVFELCFKSWTESNDNSSDNFIVGWRLVTSEKIGYFSSGRVKYCKSASIVNRTWGLQMTGDVIFSLTPSQLRYQSYHIIYLKKPTTLCMISTRSTNLSDPPSWCFLWN